MKQLLTILFAAILFTSSAQNLSNKGREFWVGYGHNTIFTLASVLNSQELVLYLSAEQATTVKISINGTTYSQIYNIPANSVIQTLPIPKSGTDDARLTAEGLSTKGIHIQSSLPIVAYAHQYGLNSSGATMLMPVETYGYTYYSLNFTQLTNATPAYSWFYAIASEDNTKLEITPSALTNGGNAAGITFNVTLNKGEIYNVFGASSGTSGNDLTGSKIKSVVGADGDCHPIAVFSGSSRMLICGTSGDVMQQQIFPSSAWGTTYLTYPTVNSTNVAQTNTNYFRIAVRDPSTIVRKNGFVLTGLINNFYYEFTSTNGDFIEANKPILMSQYILSSRNCINYSGDGDPEMFFLSPIEQSIKKASFYSTSNQNILHNYVAVIIKSAGLASLKIDGSNVFALSIVHPINNQYSVIIDTLVGNQQHTIISDSTFNAITYGFGTVESYGYNAGTAINNLDLLTSYQNTFSQTGASTFTCPKSPFKISIKLAYKASQIKWLFSQVSNVSSTVDTTLINPIPSDSSFIFSRLYYDYQLPRNYFISDTGLYKIPLTVKSPEIDNCNNSLDYVFKVKVKTGPKPVLNPLYSACKVDTATISAGGSTGFNITKWYWFYDDATKDSGRTVKKVFNAFGNHPTLLQVIADNGCIGDTTQTIVTSFKPISPFGVSVLPSCVGSTIKFSDSSAFLGSFLSWYWDFGNGQTTTTFNNNPINSTYLNPGIYTVKHFVQTTGSCRSDTASKTFQIFAKPKVNFGFKAGCSKNGFVQFSDSTMISDGQVISYQWNFADPNATVANPNISTIKNPSHLYSVFGTYNVKLVITTANGCKDSLSRMMTINPQTAALFIIDSSLDCFRGNTILFTNSSTVPSGTMSYNWNFGDGSTSTTTSPNHSYITVGTYTVKLIATSSTGCKDSLSQTVRVSAQPKALFTIDSTNDCARGNTIIFTNNSTISNGTMSYIWSFGDGGTSTVSSQSHSYLNAGTYTIKLIVSSNGGCKDSISHTVRINTQPIALFTIDSTADCIRGNNFIFTNNSSIASGTLIYNWSFGDGGNSTLIDPNHAYTIAGTYTIKLIVTSNNGCKDSLSKTIRISPQPTASFNIDSSADCIRGNNIVFANTSTVTSGTISYNWSFGDGGSSALMNPNHSYTTPGVYIIKLVVTSNNGCKDSINKTVRINPQSISSFGIDSTINCVSGNNIVFNNTSTIVNIPSAYNWSFGDGTISNITNPNHTYASSGIYTVKLIVINSNGCKDSISHTVRIAPQPKALFSIDSTADCVRGNNILFTNTSTSASGTLIYNWSFGDGGTSSATNPNHAYVSAGIYTVKLIVTSSYGCKDSISQSVRINPQPIAAFSIDSTADCARGNNIIFTNSSTIANGSISYNWSFGDGSISTAISPNHTYTNAGIYTVKLVVISSSGCKDSINQTVRINPQPIALFSIDITMDCLRGNNLVFINKSTIANGTVSYNWSFGDGGISTAVSPNHTYTNAGTYTVKLVVTSSSGCKDSINQTVIIHPQPIALFSIDSTADCVRRNNIIFTNKSVIPNGTITYNWSFGDGGTSTIISPNHTYANAGTYTVKLIAISDKGCKDTLIQTVRINPQSIALFSIDSTFDCLRGNNIVFTNNTLNAVGTNIYNWNFGDGGISNVTSPNHTYANGGNYIVELIVTSNNGCKDTLDKTVRISTQPTAAFSIDSTANCTKGNNIFFTSNATIASGILFYNWSFGDRGTSTATNPNHSYASAGTFTVKLIVISNNGCKDSINQTVRINLQSIALFSIDSTADCMRGNTIIFTNNSTNSSIANSFTWSFGDGNNATSNSPNHSYLLAGIYNVKLLVISNTGCNDSISQLVSINPQPTAAFNIDSTKDCTRGNNIIVANNSTITSGSISYYWNFGDGSISNAISPNHVYGNAGVYTIKHIVTSNNGCMDSITHTVRISPQPIALFSIDSTADCFRGNNILFTNNSSIASGSINNNWAFGDGSNASSISPNHTYTIAATNIVKLIVTSDNGCMDSASQKVIIHPQPAAGFTIANPVQCLQNNRFTFTNTASISNGVIKYAWNFGDSQTSIDINPNHTYNVDDTFSVKQIVTSDFGCIDSLEKPVIVQENPKATFTINQPVQCLNGNSFIFTNTTIPFASGTWFFNDGASSTSVNTSKSYSRPGDYQVKLLLNSLNNCKPDSTTKIVTVNPSPAVSLGSDIAVLENGTVNFKPIVSSTGLSYLWKPATFLNSNSILSPFALPKTDITYTLTVTGVGGCKESDDISIKILKIPTIPNVFSPNGDGINDTWVIKYLNDFPGATVDVFNRYGASVFSSNGYARPWDGNVNSKPLPIGTYYYIIDPKNGIGKLTGSVTILR